MNNVLIPAFAIAGAAWIAGVALCIIAIRLLVGRGSATRSKTVALSTAAAAIALGGSVISLSFDYSSGSTHWYVDSRWFFRPLLVVATVALIAAVAQWWRASKKA
jgi:hypothetical protein